ncbi:hypothetical protein FGK63_16940 [Ruegeria sediminis]|uniref:Uncharacterized protein n=1 Tax=Ruegeria sediminis TaxID=2583820 RepID=A0ABY2WU03_9RHOB|nr:DUF6629 family protein [Ruegeria sediminis]TMV04770.1 hypothetical protein FGK63_16940 [Ruegeria sediminis]
MCFSAQASFIAGAALVTCGGVTLHMARQAGARYLPLASLPLVFGLQQVSEGVLWLSFDTAAGPSLAAALVFLFFAYWFWPFWVPMSSAMIETDPRRRRVFSGIAVLGFCLGALLFLPVLLGPDKLDIYLMKHSIRYENAQMFPNEGAKLAARLVYAAVICAPLIGSSLPQLRGFGYLILASVAAGLLFASYAFTSIWCFLAAVISAYIYVVLRAVRSARPLALGASHAKR